ncbi:MULTISPECIES: alanyl-tRNA editing protein [Acutalibacteraceae]|uniref:alanyl-tRNA editing protein n=1 Tax=Acutalibacteraceae TaxID=3082771 RepID=UPI0013E8DC97|nr:MULTISPECIES: alanyl-tRNA editing protein [Acutalibacteraceae]
MNRETEKLYDLNPKVRTFQAHVLECIPKEERYLLILDRTAFYPEGGGQPSDRGVLNFANILDVQEKDGVIVHTSDRPISPGALVSGGIDWPRRFALMQQHTGEHIVSGLAHRLYGLDNVGFHMSDATLTVDLNGELSSEQLALIERLANEAVWRDLAIKVMYPSGEELEKIPYRSKKELTGKVRIVEIPGFDVCACCGTHVTRTGEIGAIKLLFSQHYKGGTRLTMACGGQALRDYGERLEGVSAVSVLLSAKPADIEQAARHLLQENSDLKRRLSVLQTELFQLRANTFPSGCGSILAFEDDLAPDEIRRFSLALSKRCSATAAVFSGSDAQGYRYAVSDAVRDVRPYATELSSAFSGRGGGPKELVQGSVRGMQKDIISFFEKKDFHCTEFEAAR